MGKMIMRLKPSKGFIQNATGVLKKSLPTLLSCLGAVGVVATAVLAAKATPKAITVIKREQIERWDDNTEEYPEIPLTEKIGLTWRCYIPTIITGMTTIGCIFGANAINKRQQAALLSAYAFIDRSFREYKNAVKEVFGDEGYKQVVQHLAVENPVPPAIYGSLTGESFDFGVTDDEKHLFYDAFSHRYFNASFSDVLLAELHTNRNFAIGGEVYVHYFYDFLGLDTPKELMELAWYYCDSYYFIDFTHEKTIVDDGLNNEPVECWVIDMTYPPTIEPIED